MRWLLHGLPVPVVSDALKRHGQDARTADQIGLTPDATHEQILDAARKQQLEIMTADAALAEAPYGQASLFNRLIVWFNVPSGEEEFDDAVDRFLERYPRPVAGRLYTVTASRVKVRQLPTQLRTHG